MPILFAFFFQLSVWAGTSSIQLEVDKYTLPNGMTVLLHVDNSIPAVSVQTWYRVGSKDEVVGRTGLAHFFEHMMFKGTKKYPASTWGKFLNSKGADLNAFTSMDYTGYYINAPSEHLELLLDIESNRMRQLTLDPGDVTREREVVKEERRMRYDDSIEGSMREALFAMMWEKAPYHWLPIGYMADLNAASLEDLHAFYKQFYSPNNAVLVVAGAFDPQLAKTWIETYFGQLPREEIKRPQPEAEPEQKAMRKKVISREAQAPSVAVSYRLPDQNHDDHYALALLGNILGQGQSSRLYKSLVYKQQMATSIHAWASGLALGGDFNVMATLKPKTKPDAALEAIEKEINKLRTSLVGAAELEKARNAYHKGFVDSLKRASGRARLLASYEIRYGDHTRMISDFEKIQAVTPQDIQRVVKTYLQPKLRNIVIVEPKVGVKK